MNAFSDRIGLTTEESVANALNLGSFGGARGVGIIGEFERGVENKRTSISNLREFRRIFGNNNPSYYSPYTVEMLFNNAGGYGVDLEILRMLGVGSAAAQGLIRNISSADESAITTIDQVATAGLPQVNKVVISNVDVGDQFAINFTTPVVGFNFVATTNDAADVYAGLAALINANATIIAASIVATAYPDRLDIRKTINNSPFTQTSTASNTATAAVTIATVFAGRQGSKDKGTWGNNVRVKTYPIGHKSGSINEYKLEVYFYGVKMEEWFTVGAVWQTLLDVVNGASDFIYLEPNNLAQALTIDVSDVTLTGGVYVAPEDSAFQPYLNLVTQAPEGMALFGSSAVEVIAAPEVFTSSFAKIADTWALANNKFFITSMPYLATEATMQAFYTALFLPQQSATAGYPQWAEITDEVTKRKVWVPALGYVLGAGYVRKAGMFNGAVWTPPGGEETFAKGIHRFTHDDIDDAVLSRYVTKWSANMIKFVDRVGYCLWSSRTYSTNTLFVSIHVRLETNWLLKQIKTRNGKVIQKIYSPGLEKSVEIDNTLFFKNLYDQGGVDRTLAFEEAVIINAYRSITNPRELELDIAWIPPECVEHLHIKLNRNDGVIVQNALS